MKVLIACECSNTVRDAFLRLGHDAYSCDLQRADHPNPNWRRHIRGDVRPLLKEKWDLVIAHPPCTYLSRLSACRFISGIPIEQQPRYNGILNGVALFLECLGANAQCICVENPRMHKYAQEMIGVPHTQEIQPCEYGHPYTKATWLWLIGLPPLTPTNIISISNTIPWVDGSGRNRGKRGKVSGPNGSKLKAQTFSGIAQAMAEQWGK